MSKLMLSSFAFSCVVEKKILILYRNDFLRDYMHIQC